MLNYPNIDPVALDIFGIKIHWYGLMYLFAFGFGYFLLKYRAKNRPEFNQTKDQVSDLVFYGAMGVVLGGRLGYIFFYNFSVFIENPLILIRVWEGGMSFHGGLIGVILMHVIVDIICYWVGRMFFLIVTLGHYPQGLQIDSHEGRIAFTGAVVILIVAILIGKYV
jgi:prolipoprotein diacylglyceryl transferase